MLSLVASSIGWKERKEHHPSGFDALDEVTEGKITIHLLCYQLCLWHLEKLQIVALLNPQYRPHLQRLHFSWRLMLAARHPISSICFPAPPKQCLQDCADTVHKPPFSSQG